MQLQIDLFPQEALYLCCQWNSGLRFAFEQWQKPLERKERFTPSWILMPQRLFPALVRSPTIFCKPRKIGPFSNGVTLRCWQNSKVLSPNSIKPLTCLKLVTWFAKVKVFLQSFWPFPSLLPFSSSLSLSHPPTHPLTCLPSPSSFSSLLPLNIKILSVTSALLVLMLTFPRVIKLQGSFFFKSRTHLFLSGSRWEPSADHFFPQCSCECVYLCIWAWVHTLSQRHMVIWRVCVVHEVLQC